MLTYTDRLAAMRRTKIEHTRQKQRQNGFVDMDDFGTVPLPEGYRVEPWYNSQNGSFYGYGGVNRYFGNLAVPFDNGKFAIKGTPGVTMMFGPDLDKEQDYLKALTSADQWKINSDQELELYSNGKKTAVFEYKPEIRPNK